MEIIKITIEPMPKPEWTEDGKLSDVNVLLIVIISIQSEITGEFYISEIYEQVKKTSLFNNNMLLELTNGDTKIIKL